ncbi:alpha/beta fold hydrolase [Yaniella flava]|uniref:Alpha/beta fold hydrolase n=1 Tax=Yaniella flava TaxID=287930 RepID=A0ABP5FGL8_9MICC|nr:alpha/beta fold hydrolase [Micrococcaceae bacterium]
MQNCSDPAARIHTERVEGGARRVVFLHGLMGRGKNFTSIARGLIDTTTSLLMDLPNHGASCWTSDFDYIEMADLVADELRRDFCRDEPAVVLGHSMGGKVAMVLALRHPDVLAGLIIEDIAPLDSSTSEFEHLLGTLLKLDLDSLTARTDAHAALKTDINDDAVRGFLLQNLVRDGQGGFQWEPNLQMLFDNLGTLSGFPMIDGVFEDHPVLWIKGEHSNYVTDEAGEVMRELFPMTRKIQIRDAGHWIHAEQPKRFIETLDYYVAGRY